MPSIVKINSNFIILIKIKHVGYRILFYRNYLFMYAKKIDIHQDYINDVYL